MTYPSIYQLEKLGYESVTDGYKKSEEDLFQKAVAQLAGEDYKIGTSNTGKHICRPKSKVRLEIK